MWTREALHELVVEKLRDYLFVVVSNREPYVHSYVSGAIHCDMPPSGLTTALDPIMRACGGTWVAHGGGNADRDTVDENDRIRVPPGDPRYTLRRVWLSKEEEDAYYYGFSNDALWPLCHIAYTRPTFNEAEWNVYRTVNERFANAVLEEVGTGKAFVFVQDYHLTLLPRLLREANPELIIAQFWHIPWPNPEAFRVCPWQAEILTGLLGNHLLGFHLRYHCNNFLDTVDRALEARVDRDRYEAIHGGEKTAIRPFPISIDFEDVARRAQDEAVQAEMERLKLSLEIKGMLVGMGLDRIDYTKGIPDRLRAFDRFLERYPHYRNKVVFIQTGVPSRVHVPAYRRINDEIDSLIEEVNWKYETEHWRPIIDLRGPLPPLTVMALRRLADFAIVSSLHDGMNLVAKEYVASSVDERGVLILSLFTGAARELTDAILVNPYATDYFAEAIRAALEMPLEEKQRRMRRMRAIVQENNIYKWAADIVTEMAKVEFGA
ncbi:MAG: trehalose-6-phosphate synthase [Dehalococcoidia bacterium]|nr:trehalose-6-phosphate synthase [Dehalococcoidia bacterium]